MLRKIEIKNHEHKIVLLCDGEEIISIAKNNLVIDGKQLFDNFITNLDITTKVDFDYIDDLSITDSNEKRIVNDIKTVLNNIAKNINEKFNLMTDDIDKFLE